MHDIGYAGKHFEDRKVLQMTENAFDISIPPLLFPILWLIPVLMLFSSVYSLIPLTYCIFDWYSVLFMADSGTKAALELIALQ